MASNKDRRAKHLRIVNPCNEAWEQMTPRGPGRFCDQCQHTVLDLSRASRSEAQQLLDTHNELSCVKLRVDNDGLPVYQSPTKRALRPLALGFGLLAACGAKNPLHVMGDIQRVQTPDTSQTTVGEATVVEEATDEQKPQKKAASCESEKSPAEGITSAEKKVEQKMQPATVSPRPRIRMGKIAAPRRDPKR